MKPNFALLLSTDSVCLLHRTSSGWARIGEVDFDAPDLDAALKELRGRASHLPGDRRCKLVLPQDQIKYLTAKVGGDPDETVRAALDGATPYAVNELEYDWTAEGGEIRIAAVALETLAEAESFAVKHGFEPVSFAAIPSGTEFVGEPFFGVTKWAATALPKGANVERDDAPTHITSDASPPQPGDEGGDDGADGPDDDAAPVAAAATRAVAEAGPARKVEPAKESVPALDTPAQPKAPTPRPDATHIKTAPQVTDNKTSTPKAPPQESAAPAAFTSIRASRNGTGAGAPRVATPSRLSQLGGADTAPATAAAPPLPSPASDDVTDPARIAELAASLQPDPKIRLDQSATDQGDAKGSQRSEMPGLFVRSAATKDRAAQAAAATGPALRHADEKQRMTVFGARQSAVRGKPRFLGLILTALLLLFLVGVAAWASAFLDDGLARFFRRGDDMQLADVPTANEAVEDAADNAIAPLPDGDTPRIAALPRDNTPRPEVAALPDRTSPLAPSEAMARYAATGIWQMAPAAPEIPGAGAPVDDIYQVSIDPSVSFGALASLPRRQPDARDTRPEKPSDPPPAGMRFDFDERGFVRATPGGAMTPGGVRVVAGQPPLTPPTDMAQTVTVTVEIGSNTGGEEGQIATSVGDPALAAVRPRVRPQTALSGNDAGTAQEDQSVPQQDDETQLIPTESETRTANAASTAAFVGDPSLAALRPRPRPASAAGDTTLRTAAGSDVAALAAGATLNGALTSAAQAGAQIADAAEEPEALDASAFASATPQAVTASLTPLRRPGDFEKIVKRTRAQAAATPVPVSQQVQPALPTRASVAKQATDEKVLNLREVNLIGVYGSTASRRALVRLGNGRYQKVRVGDKLDGGQVAAIGNSELHYVKRGRNVVLKMPQG